jgi:signal transduction histidine kinase
MRLRARLALGLFAIVLLLVAPLAYALVTLTQLRVQTTELRDNEFEASLLVARVQGDVAELREGETRFVLFPDSAAASRVTRAIASMVVRTDTLAAYPNLGRSEELRESIRRVRDLAAQEVAIGARAQPDRNKMLDSISDLVRSGIEQIELSLRSTTHALGTSTQERVNRSVTVSTFAWSVASIATALALVAALGIALWLILSISRPVRDLERGMHAVADGNFGVRLRIAPLRHDEFGRLSASFEKMAAQLAQLDQLKAEFVSVASHELKTPINVIIGYLQLLQEGVYGPMTPKQQEICATLSSQAHSLSRLVRQLLDVSRFEAGGGKLDVRRVNLAAFLGDLESAFRVLALQRGVVFEIDRGPDLPTAVVWDEDRMNEVLGNLLSNAFKFTDRGGRVELAVTADDGSVHLEVQDTGAGIPAQQLPRIFDKFYQADNQASAAGKGTGLGLAIAKGIVEAHGGTISVDSTVGVGTTFMIAMPIAPHARRAITEQRRAFAAAMR